MFVFSKMKLDPRCSGYLARDIDLPMIRISDVFPHCKKAKIARFLSQFELTLFLYTVECGLVYQSFIMRNLSEV